MRLRSLVPLFLVLSSAALASEVPLTPPPPLMPSTIDDFGVAGDGGGFLFLLGTAFTTSVRRHFHGWTLDGAESTFDTGDNGAVAAGDSGYLVVAANNGGNVVARRVATSGEVLDAAPLIVGPTGTFGSHFVPLLAVAWDGSRWVVVSSRVSFVDRNGGVSGGGVAIGDLASDTSVSMAARNGVAVVVWRARGALFARTISVTAMSDPIPLGAATGFAPQIAAGDDGFLATWSINGTLVARHFDANGRPDAFFELGLNADRARIAWDGSAYVVVARSGAALRGIRASATAPLGVPFDIAGDANDSDLAIASAGSRILVGYGEPSMYVRFLGETGAAIPVYPHLASQKRVRAAFDGVDEAVLFQQELPNYQNELRLARVTTRGEPLDGAGFVVAGGPIELADVAGGGGMILVTWTELHNGQEDIRAQRFTAAGTPLDPAPLLLAANTVVASRPIGVWDGSGFVVFYSPYGRGTFGIRIGDGSSEQQVHPAAALQFNVARSADRFMLAYGQIVMPRAVAVTDDLHLATGSVDLGPPNEGALTIPSIASDGSDFLAVWQVFDNNDAVEIVAQGVSGNADLLGGRIVVGAGPHAKGNPRVRWDGAWWTVTWAEVVDAETIAFVSARITRSGEPLAPVYIARTPLTDSPSPLYDWTEAGSMLFYSRFDRPSGLVTAQRIFLQREDAARRGAAGR